MKTTDYDKIDELYGRCAVFYRIGQTGNLYQDEVTTEGFEKLKAALAKIGVCMNIEDGILSIELYPQKFVKTTERNAGRRKKYSRNPDSNDPYRSHYTILDISDMTQSMTDKEIAEKIQMPIATFYRHKKVMKEKIVECKEWAEKGREKGDNVSFEDLAKKILF